MYTALYEGGSEGTAAIQWNSDYGNFRQFPDRFGLHAGRV